MDRRYCALLTQLQVVPVAVGRGPDPDRPSGYTCLDVASLARRLLILQHFDCLDIVNAEPIVTALRSQQIIPGNKLRGRPPLPASDRARVHGLFHCYDDQPLRDTYFALTVLSTLGGLDRIDRDACVEGILRFHRGEGIFGSNDPNDALVFRGDAQDTFCGYESLRILGALDRVRDIERWRFRPAPAYGQPLNGPDEGSVTWLKIEAWLYQHRLDQYLSQRRQRPSLTPPSLRCPVVSDS